MKKEHSAGIIPVWIKEGLVRFLLLKSKQHGHWMFPKGRREPGEEDRETAHRELLEETGIDDVCLIADAVFVEKWFYTEAGEDIAKDVKYFLGIVTNETVTPQPEEVAEYRWVTLAEAKKLLTHPSKAGILKQALELLKQEQLVD